MNIIRIIQGIMVVLIFVIAFLIIRDFRKNNDEGDVSTKDKVLHYIIGFLTNFFDALGIGSFATTMAAYRLTKLVPDRLIPGTLNVGDCIPVLVEALAFLTVISIDPFTIVVMLISGVIGAVIGVRIVNRMPTNLIRVAMGVALAVAAVMMILSQLNVIQAGGNANGLRGYKLMIGICSQFILGMLLPLGIGNYAPTMVVVYMLGMSADMAFPIMMSSGALVLASSTMSFIPTGQYHRRGAVSLTAAGVVGVLCAVFLVKSMPLYVLKWIVVVVVLYTSVSLFRDARKHRVEKELAEEGIE